MALDRQSIERRDFPIGRRGYDPEAVDAHLRMVAEDVDAIERSSREQGGSLAQVASDQVRLIIEASEATAEEIRRSAEQEARTLRVEAADVSHQARESAETQAREQVAQVRDATEGMLARIGAMESEFGALAEALRTGVERLRGDLSSLQGSVGDLRSATDSLNSSPSLGTGVDAIDHNSHSAAPPAHVDPDPYAIPAVEPAPIAESAYAVESSAYSVEPVETDASAEAREGARLIALNMALNGTPREETDRYLADNFDIGDRAGLLDEVYARVG